MRESENETEASTTFYLYDREDRIADYDPSGNLLISYTHGPGIDEPVAMTLSNSTYFYIPDIQGSIRAIISADNGSLAAYYTYDAWGNLVSYGGPMAEKNDYLYTGREYDWQTGIYYYRYRYYNPEIGRFIQSSWEHTKEMNMYVYVGNDPANNEDPTGHPGYTPPYVPDHEAGGTTNRYAPGSCWSYCVECCKAYHSGSNIITGNRCVGECRERCHGTWCGKPSEWIWLKCYPRPLHATCQVTEGQQSLYVWGTFMEALGSLLKAPFSAPYTGGSAGGGHLGIHPQSIFFSIIVLPIIPPEIMRWVA